MFMDKEKLLELSDKVSEIALKASQSIMDIYTRREITLEKKEDGSPLTEADLISHKILVEGLNSLGLNFSILSEEDKPKHKLDDETFWLIDPLDGTKEFLDKNGDFTVNVALIEKGSPLLGIVSAPAKGELFKGILGVGAYKTNDDGQTEIKTKTLNKELITITVSRSHQTEKDKQVLNSISKNFNEIEIIEAGSSLKLCRVAEGLADIYCRMGPTYQWDIAAGQAVAEAAGGALKTLDGNDFFYTFDSEKKNPEFYCVGDTSFVWKTLFS
jgi:3'(2'), 5'-bisphosphate nucleotidase|tara:strand:+ start:22 stop:834 length:813 start_codon:yes stop_codon:yes gene_type:complete